VEYITTVQVDGALVTIKRNSDNGGICFVAPDNSCLGDPFFYYTGKKVKGLGRQIALARKLYREAFPPTVEFPEVYVPLCLITRVVA